MPTAKKRSTTRSSSSSKTGSSRGSSTKSTGARKSSSRSSSSGSGSSPSRGRSQDAIALLTQDHRRVQKMFKQAEKLDREDDAEELQQIVQTACQELTLHTQLEEELFYPALAAVADEDDQDLVREAQIEHNSAKQLIAQLEQMSPQDDSYQATFKVLGEYVNHHIQEEETEMFPAAKKAKVDVKAIGQEILQQKEAAGMGDGSGAQAAQGARGQQGSQDEEMSDDEETTSQRR
jgi:hemerythrin-like domain-containing protein